MKRKSREKEKHIRKTTLRTPGDEASIRKEGFKVESLSVQVQPTNNGSVHLQVLNKNARKRSNYD